MLGHGGVGVSLRTSRQDKGSIILVGRMDGSFKDGRLVRGIDVRVRFHSQATVIKSGKSKGSALIGVVLKRLRPSTKRVHEKDGLGINCLSRRIFTSTSSRSIVSTFERKLTMARKRTHRVLTNFLFCNCAIFHGISRLDNNRGVELHLTRLVRESVGFLVLSRPAGRLSVRSERMLRRTLRRFGKAVLTISRSHCFVGQVFDGVC